VNFVPRGQTIKCSSSPKLLLKSSFNGKHRHRSLKTQETIIILGWALYPHTLYNPELVASHFHLFGALKGAMSRKKFGSEEEILEELAVGTKFQLVQEGERCSLLSVTKDC
jgi:hypothetical protein